MDGTIYNLALKKRFVVLVGTWDPLLSFHLSLIKEAEVYARNNGLAVLVIILDPFPSDLILDRVSPIFNSCNARIEILKAETNATICKILMTKDDVSKGSRDFFTYLESINLPIAEIWLHKNQTLGRCSENSILEMQKVCDEMNITLKTLPINHDINSITHKIKAFLIQGNIESAIATAEKIPLWKKEENEKEFKIGWKPGKYSYRPVPFSNNIKLENNNTLIIYEKNRGTYFDWPDSYSSELIHIFPSHLNGTEIH